MYGSWNRRHNLNNLKNQNLEKMKKMPGDIIILQMTIIWCMVPEILSMTGKDFLLFWTIFWPFTSLTTWKSKFKKKWKKPWIYYHCTLVYHKWRSYNVWFLRYGTQQTEFFQLFWAIYIKNQNFEKMKIIAKICKKLLEISSFYTSVPNIMIPCYTVPEIWQVTD